MKYEIYAKIRDEKGCKDAQVANECGFGKSTFSDWKSGRSVPKLDKLQKIADYFNVPITYFTEGGDSAPAAEGYYLNPETAEIAQEIFENRELRLLFDSAKDAEPSDLQTVHQMLLALKRKETPTED